MNSTAGIRLTAVIVVCMSWCLPARAQETAPPAGRTVARSASPIAAAEAILDPAQAANWASRNGIALSIAAVGTAGQDNPTPQAQPSSPGTPARSRLHPAAKQKRWTAGRIAVLAVGVGLTGAGAYLLATGSSVPKPVSAVCVPTAYNSCLATTVWDGKKKAGIVLLGVGAPVSLAALLVH